MAPAPSSGVAAEHTPSGSASVAAAPSAETKPVRRGVIRDRRGSDLSGAAAAGLPASLKPWLGELGPDGHASSGLQQRFDDRLSTGADVTTSLDARWHARLEKAFAGVERAAGAIVTVPDGRVRALYSTLPHDPEPGLAAHHLVSSRPVNSGSTMKPFTAVAALSVGALSASTHHRCTGQVKLGQHSYRCWGVHGDMDVKKALALSDNAFFYQVALKMKHDDMAKAQHLFGLGEPISLFKDASAGLVPFQEHYQANGKPLDPGATLTQSIGHGEVAVTPLQLVRAYVALASGALPELSLSESETTKSVALPESWAPHLTLVRHALHGTLSESYGTAFFAGPIPDVAGKTGTAQQTDPSQHTPGTSLGWFAGWAPAEHPRIAFAFVVDGNGGRKTAQLVLAALKDIAADE